MRASLFTLTLIACSVFSWAQRGAPPNVSRPAEVRIQVVTANDRSIENAVQVELTSVDGVPIDTASTGGEGFALFHGMNPGSYRVRVSGTAIETTTSDVFAIMPGEGMHREVVHVNLRAPRGDQRAQASPTSGGPTISAAELNVPPKARNEMDKGMEAFTKGDLNKAVERFQKAVAIYPQYSQAYYNLGVTLMKMGDPIQAKDAFQKSVSVNDHFAPGYINLARLAVADKNFPDATVLLNKALAIAPNNLEALSLLASVQLMNQDLDQALATARKAHSIPHQGYADVHLVAADVLVLQHHEPEAIAEYETYLQEYPDSPRASQVRQALAKMQAQAQ
ncbi:MAG TPA: tetratricopeptide repeat protein [Terriglobales bacterium]|nr:tetratricopeptide repeat protein [Terriglobales bacterium]